MRPADGGESGESLFRAGREWDADVQVEAGVPQYNMQTPYPQDPAVPAQQQYPGEQQQYPGEQQQYPAQQQQQYPVQQQQYPVAQKE